MDMFFPVIVFAFILWSWRQGESLDLVQSLARSTPETWGPYCSALTLRLSLLRVVGRVRLRHTFAWSSQRDKRISLLFCETPQRRPHSAPWVLRAPAFRFAIRAQYLLNCPSRANPVVCFCFSPRLIDDKTRNKTKPWLCHFCQLNCKDEEFV